MSDEATGSDAPAEGDHESQAAAAGPFAHHHRKRTIGLIVVAVVVVLGGLGALMLFGGEKPEEISDQAALDRFRTEGSAESTTTTAPETGLAPPKAGVYAYRGTGKEVTSFPPLTEQEGPDMPATVTHTGDGCWTFRIDYNTHHWQTHDFCSTETGLTNSGGETFARRDFVTVQIDNTSLFTCDPPQEFLWTDMQPGQTRDGSCSGTSTVLEGTATDIGTVTYVGRESIEVAGTTIEADHIHFDHVIGGVQSGKQTAEWWFQPETGLPLRNERSLVVDTGTPIGDITYTEDASYEIVSLDPRT